MLRERHGVDARSDQSQSADAPGPDYRRGGSGGGEAVDMIAALNTGHDGGMSTIHANSAFGVFGRLETMFLSAVQYPVDAVRGQISTGIDIVVHLSRLRDGSRRILDISELLGFDGGKTGSKPALSISAGGGH